MRPLRSLLTAGLLAFALIGVTIGVAAATGDPLVTHGSLATTFSHDKQNEPAVAIDADHPTILAAGANDEIDIQGCNGSSCPLHVGVGVSGIYFSFDSGATWTQPTYIGWSERSCLGGPCTAGVGPIGTLPWYYENGLVSDGDPALSFGPRMGPDGTFSWANGSRLYYANLTSNFPSTSSFKGFEAIAVSRTDNVAAAAASDQSAWLAPVVISRQSSTTFSDKEQIWADNAASSPFFGTVYVCWASYRSLGAGPGPLTVAVSHDGGDSWTQRQVTDAANNMNVNPADGCTVRTDSTGVAYVFGVGSSSSHGHQSFELMSQSSDGGATWTRARPVAGPVTQPGVIDPIVGRPVIDGIAGARSDAAPAPSVDIANGAPSGADATDRIVMTYVSGDLAQPHVYFTESTDHGATWSIPRPIETGASDRPIYSAPAISPNGTDVYVVYDAFTTPYRTNTTDPRILQGVVLHADSSMDLSAATGAFGESLRGAPGDPRSSSANALQAEFIGDYVYAAATRSYGTAVWNDARNGADCPAIDAYRASLEAGSPIAAPAPLTECPTSFGNSDIYGASVTDPTP